MDELEDLQMDRTFFFFFFYTFTIMEDESKGLESCKASLSFLTHTQTHIHTRPWVIHYWPFRGGTIIVVLFVKCYVVFHFLMFYFQQVYIR